MRKRDFKNTIPKTGDTSFWPFFEGEGTQNHSAFVLRLSISKEMGNKLMRTLPRGLARRTRLGKIRRSSGTWGKIFPK